MLCQHPFHVSINVETSPYYCYNALCSNPFLSHSYNFPSPLYTGPLQYNTSALTINTTVIRESDRVRPPLKLHTDLLRQSLRRGSVRIHRAGVAQIKCPL